MEKRGKCLIVIVEDNDIQLEWRGHENIERGQINRLITSKRATPSPRGRASISTGHSWPAASFDGLLRSFHSFALQPVPLVRPVLHTTRHLSPLFTRASLPLTGRSRARLRVLHDADVEGLDVVARLLFKAGHRLRGESRSRRGMSIGDRSPRLRV